MVGDSAALNITGRGFKWVFRVTPIASDYAATYMRFFADMKKQGKTIDSIAIVNENTDYGTSVADAVEAAKPRNPGSRSRSAFPTARARPTSSAQVLQLKEKKPDVGDLHQLHLGLHPLHEDDEEPRLPAADGDRRR